MVARSLPHLGRGDSRYAASLRKPRPCPQQNVTASVALETGPECFPTLKRTVSVKAEGMVAMTDDQRMDALEAVLAAFNDHDLDRIMSFFVDDCEFDTPRGPTPYGRQLRGLEEVRAGFAARFAGIPDISYEDDAHWVTGDRGASEWTIRGTDTDGRRVEVRGCDLFVFEGNKIKRKDSFWKIVE